MGNEALPAVPHLTTAPHGPPLPLETLFLDNQSAIEHWFRARFTETPAPFYCSVDLRNSGFKLAPVDTNLFPAGYNNLNPAFYPLTVQAIQTAIDHVCPSARNMLLIPENHTRNTYYLENLATLSDLLRAAGLNLRIGTLLPEITQATTLDLPSGRSVTLEPLTREGNRIKVGGDFDPCTLLLNNDLSAGSPPILEGIEQPVIPPLALGWWKRRKSNHFLHYQTLARNFAEYLDIDPWFITPAFMSCGKIDFQKREGEECLASSVDFVLNQVATKYRELGIAQEPFVIVKADSGTYGMGIMTVKKTEDVRDLNRKQRTKMAYGKEGQTVSEVLVQEGIYTFETWEPEHAVAEPVVYMFDRFVVGGFYRVHRNRGKDENLNAPGSHFEPLAFAEPGTYPDLSGTTNAVPNRFYAYGVVARLALLAAARETQEAGGVKKI
ncbi:MAG: glutamate--cysteine ligase [Pseudomonadota bacterium]